MSLFNTLATGASGLASTGAGMAVIGDNIANMSTNGYKKGRIQFEDMLPQTMGTRNGLSMLGRGVGVGGIGVMHIGGTMKSSNSLGLGSPNANSPAESLVIHLLVVVFRVFLSQDTMRGPPAFSTTVSAKGLTVTGSTFLCI